jgi:serine/threonine-protein kinase HipA
MIRCPGCLKQKQTSFCVRCRQRLFDGHKVSPILHFTRPEYDKAKGQVTPERLSLSGVQTKLPVALRGGRLELVDSGGHYILKPIPRGEFQHQSSVPINEHLTMLIARQVFQIEVAEHAMVSFADDEPAYLVRRFDLLPDGTRLLMEDFAQIAARSEETHGQQYKYDFSYEEMGELIQRHVITSAITLERFFMLVLFNYYVHNGDAHLKNFALLRREDTGEYQLAPAYDLLNTHLHLPNESRTALDLFRDDYASPSYEANGFYAYDDFVELAQRFKLVEVRYRRILQSFVDKHEAVCSLVASSSLPVPLQHQYLEYLTSSRQALEYSFARQR